MYGVYISQLLRFARTCDRYSDFLARHKRLVRTLLDQGFRYGLLCRKFKQFYPSHHSLNQRYPHSVTQHLREGVDSQVRWWRIRILLVVQWWLAPIDYQFTLSLVSSWLFPPFYFFFTSVLLIFKLLIDFSSFYLSFLSFLFFSFLLSPLSYFLLLSVSPLQLFIIWVCAFL